MNIKNSEYKSRILEFIDGLSLITNKKIQEFFPEIPKQRINEILSEFSKKGIFIKLERGKYTLKTSFSYEDLVKLSLEIYPGYIGYSSALYLYGLIDYESTTIFIINKYTSKELSYTNYILKYLYTTKNLDYINIQNGIPISSLEKTIFDSFYKPEYSGGFTVISKAIYDSQKKINWNKLIEIYEKYGSSRHHQITGYILELLKTNTDCKIPNKVINYFYSKVKSKIKLLNNNKLKSKLIKKWNLQDNFGSENIFSWWY